jgi:protein O-mannosyl-transferase
MKFLFRDKIQPHLVPASILILLTVAVYMRTLGHNFQLFWDDEKYVTGSEMVRGLTLEHLRSVFKGTYGGNYAPLQTLSYMADYALWGMSASGFFLTNIIIHICNGVIFYTILIRLQLGRVQAFSSVFLFLLHPVQVETVAWVSERKNLLAMFFCLLALACYIVYREKGWEGGKKAYLFCFTAFALALLSKSVAVIFPLILILYDICYTPERGRGAWMSDKVPFFCASLLMVWLTMKLQLPGDVPGMGGGRTAFHGGSPFATFLTMLVVLAWYMKLLFWPTGLSAIYDPPIKTAVDIEVVGGMILLALLIIVGVYLFLRNRKLFFWYGLFFVALLPVSQIVPIVTLMNDRYLYFPMLGASVFLVGILLPDEPHTGKQRIIPYPALALLLPVLAFLSFSRAAVWKNDLTLWSDAARKSPGHYVALYGLGQALQNSGDLNSARSVYLRVLELNPRHLDTLIHLDAIYRALNSPLKGRPYLVDVTRLYPSFPEGHLALGKNYYSTGDLDGAEKAFRTVLSLQPQSRDALSFLGVISLRKKRIAEASKFFNRTVAVGGTDMEIEYNQACVEALSGNSRKALRHLESALRLGFQDWNSLENDPDLESIRTIPDFQRIVLSYQGKGNR